MVALILAFRYGFSNMRYIASLISGVGIFMMGAGLSWYHGIMGLLHPEPIESLLWVSICADDGVIKKYREDEKTPTCLFLNMTGLLYFGGLSGV